MKTLIICFSQSGNTSRIAESIRSGVIDSGSECDMVALKDVDPENLTSYDLVGLGTPVFYYKEPFNVADFIESLPPLKRRQCFLFCTHGAVMGETLVTMAGKLEKKEAEVIGTFDCFADSTVPFYPHPTLTTGHPDTRDFDEAREFGRQIVACSRSVAAGDKSGIKKPTAEVEDWVKAQAELLTADFISRVFPPLRVNEDSCTLCGDCEDACPVDGIQVEADTRRLQDPCIFCWNCVKACPTASITADWSNLVKSVPAMFEKYRQVSDKAAEQGFFRYLVDPDSLDFENPLHKQLELKGKS